MLHETGELLRPIVRLGIPESSIADKLPYARPDASPLPNSLRPRVQKLLQSNIEHAERQEAIAAEWAALKRVHEEDFMRQQEKAGKGGQLAKPPPVPLDMLALQVGAAAPRIMRHYEWNEFRSAVYLLHLNSCYTHIFVPAVPSELVLHAS